jgi:opacity protein-like surface antigen
VVVSFRDLPMFDSSAFNFTFAFGAGLEFFRTESHSVRVEYRVQHLSNAYLGTTNPGADSQVIQTTWNWGRR